MPVQLLPVARDEQQRVVGAGAEHEHGEDALGLPVELDHVGVGELVDGEGGQTVRETGGEQRDDPEDRAAVHDQQDHQDDGERDEQQRAVDRGEHLDQVGEQPARPGDVHGEPVRRVGRDDAHGVDGGGDRVAVRAVDRHDDLERLAVLARDRRRQRRHDPGDPGEAGQVGRGRLAVAVGDAARALVHDDRRCGLPVGEPDRQVLRPGGLGVGRKERGVVVDRDLAEPARERAGHAADDQPGQDDRDRGPEQSAPLHLHLNRRSNRRNEV